VDRQIFNVGVDVGGTNTKFGLTDEKGKMLAHEAIKTVHDRGSDATVWSIIQGISMILEKASLRDINIQSIGVGVPGTVDSNTGVVVYAPNLFWNNVDIAKPLQQAFNTPVYILQDTCAAAWAEYLVGAGAGHSGVASVTLGTGIGCGLVFDGRIFHGALNSSGELGHQIVELNGNLCNCGRRGCLEAHAGGLAIMRMANEKIPGIHKLVRKSPSEVSVHDVFRLALEGHPEALEITSNVVKYIGMGLVNLINITGVEVISLSGGISNAPAELLLEPIRKFVRERAYVAVANRVQVCRSALGEDAPLVGAALFYKENAAVTPIISPFIRGAMGDMSTRLPDRGVTAEERKSESS
jgi:glucokinase